MDLPLTQITQADIGIDNGTIVISNYTGELIKFTPGIDNGHYHALVEDNVSGSVMLMRIETKFQYDTLNLYTLRARLGKMFKHVDVTLIDIGLVYKVMSTWFIGQRGLHIRPDGTVEVD